MEYLKVHWIHQHEGEPVLLLSELDSNRFEVRKIEVFADGSIGFSDGVRTSNGAMLSESPLPSAEEIGMDAQFVVEGLTAAEFEHMWSKATRKASG